MGDIGLGHDLTDPSAKSTHDGGGHVAVRQASRCGKTGSFRSMNIPRTPMTAVIRAEREGERGQGCVRRLCLLMSRLLAAAALFLEGRADPHRDQHGPGRYARSPYAMAATGPRAARSPTLLMLPRTSQHPHAFSRRAPHTLTTASQTYHPRAPHNKLPVPTLFTIYIPHDA